MKQIIALFILAILLFGCITPEKKAGTGTKATDIDALESEINEPLDDPVLDTSDVGSEDLAEP